MSIQKAQFHLYANQGCIVSLKRFRFSFQIKLFKIFSTIFFFAHIPRTSLYTFSFSSYHIWALLTLQYKKRILRHSEDIRTFKTLVEHSSTWALEEYSGTWVFETHSGFRSLVHLEHSGTWTLRTLMHLSTRGLGHLRHFSTWALRHPMHFGTCTLKTFFLVVSFRCFELLGNH